VPTKIEKDAHTGRETTGHEWDGIRELNTPLPKWWLYVLLATIVWAVVLFVLYPAWPLGRTYTKGLLGYSTRVESDKGVAEMHARHADAMAKIQQLAPADIRKDPQLAAVAQVSGRTAFANNCQPCHGPSGQGRAGYPSLADDVWLWGGKLDDIQQTITYGIRSGNAQARVSDMPRFGTDQLLTAAQIQQVADYVMVLYGSPVAGADTAPGEKLFADNCAACHGEKGQGNRDVGAPPLASHVHLYGTDRATVVAQVTQPREGVMPAWTSRLDPATIKSLALYVHALGGGEE
jgi:cytochrome c oxidase cbb3-type subunit 3